MIEISHLSTAERLEARYFLAAFASLNSKGTLSVVGTNGDNSIYVDLSGNKLVAARDGQTLRFNKSAVKRIFIAGLAGDDTIANRTDKPATLYGQAGNDTLSGGAAEETLNGGTGADRLLPGDGSNQLFADVADVVDYAGLSGRRFDIVVAPGAADETIAIIQHGSNVDQFVCIDGYRLDARLTNNHDGLVVILNTNPPPLRPTAIAVRIDMADGDDELIQGVDPGRTVTVLGGAGNDRLRGEERGDAVGFRDGGPGDDYLEWNPYIPTNFDLGDGFDTALLYRYFGSGHKSVELNGQAERFVLASGEGVIDGNAASLLDASLGTPSFISAGGGNDTIIASGGNSAFYGNGGDDLILARNGSFDFVDGGAGIDTADVDAADEVIDVEFFAAPTTPVTPWADLLPLPSPPPQLAVAEAPAPLLTPAGTLIVAGSSAANRIELRSSGARLVASTDARSYAYNAAEITRLLASGLAGSDRLTNSTSLPSTLVGDAGADTISDGGGDDMIISGEDADAIMLTRRGQDVAFIGTDDLVDYRNARVHDFEVTFGNYSPNLRMTVAGGGGSDVLIDRDESWFNLRLTDRADTLSVIAYGGGEHTFAGADIDMAGGDDTFDSISGSEPTLTRVYGGAGNDRLLGHDGNEGGARSHRFGGAGNDVIRHSGSDLDQVNGGTGDDTLELTLVGEFIPPEILLTDTIERYILRPLSVPATLLDSNRSTFIDASAAAGPFTILGNGGNDTILGSQGIDSIDGGAGDDLIQGRAGNDTLVGGPGRDRIFGGSGDDAIFARDGQRDFIDGGAGSDSADADDFDDLLNVEMV